MDFIFQNIVFNNSKWSIPPPSSFSSPKEKGHEKSILHSITDENHVQKAGSRLFPKILSGSFIKRINIAARIDNPCKERVQ